MKIGIIVTTYNRPDALEVVLRAYNKQNDLSFRMIVADDGSKKGTEDLIEEFKKESKFNISHVWHEDRGFRASAIRNKAVSMLSSDYIIFTDGDCVPSENFVSYHRKFCEKGFFLAGNRMPIIISSFIIVCADSISSFKFGGFVIPYSHRYPFP